MPLAVPDVHSSLQTGLVNAMPFPPLYVAANQYFGTTQNMLNMKWGILTAALVIDLKIWNRIKPKYQKTMLKVSEEIGIEYQLNNRKEEDEAVEVMKEYGLKVNGLSQEIVQIYGFLRKIRFRVSKKRILTICTPSDPNSRRRQDPILRFPPFPLKTLFQIILIAKCNGKFPKISGLFFAKSIDSYCHLAVKFSRNCGGMLVG